MTQPLLELQAQYQVRYCAECVEKLEEVGNKYLGWFIPRTPSGEWWRLNQIHSVVDLSDEKLTMACGLDVKQEEADNDWATVAWIVGLILGVPILAVIVFLAALVVARLWSLLLAYLSS